MNFKTMDCFLFCLQKVSISICLKKYFQVPEQALRLKYAHLNDFLQQGVLPGVTQATIGSILNALGNFKLQQLEYHWKLAVLVLIIAAF